MNLTRQQNTTISELPSGVLNELIETKIAYWISAIICPLLFFLGVIGNLYAATAFLVIRGIQKTPAILNIISIGTQTI